MCVLSRSIVSESLRPHKDCSPPGSSVQGIFQARILEWAAISSPGDLHNPRIESASPMSSALHTDSLPIELWVADPDARRESDLPVKHIS